MDTSTGARSVLATAVFGPTVSTESSITLRTANQILNMQASALFCATIGIPQASTHLLFDVDDQVVVGIYNNLDAARAKFVHRQEKLITYGGWCDVEADEVDLGKGLLDDTGGQKKVTTAWERGQP